jgi:hypothetical protein
MLHRRTILGDPWRNDVYGYSTAKPRTHYSPTTFTSPRGATLTLDSSIGRPRSPERRWTSIAFSNETRLFRPDAADYRAGDTLDICSAVRIAHVGSHVASEADAATVFPRP